MQIKGTVAVVTGAASGMGAATARFLTEKGATVALLDVNEKKLQKLQQGLFNKSHELDLHGLTEEEAIKQLNDFIYAAIRKKIEMVVIVHGKGSHHSGPLPILKNSVNQQLRLLDTVLAFCSARQEDGGSGAVYVLLRN